MTTMTSALGWLLAAILGWAEEPEAVVEIGATITPEGST